MRIRTLLLLTLVSAFYIDMGHAREYGGVLFDEMLTLPDTSRSVQLNGVGYRKKLFVKIYVGALYTESSAHSRDEVMALDGPKLVSMHIVYDEISHDKLIDAWNEGFVANLSPEAFAKLRPQIDEFNAVFPTVKKGDVINLDYIPTQGTRVTINGKQRGVIAGRDFNMALLDIWLGDKPADKTLKKAMLGR